MPRPHTGSEIEWSSSTTLRTGLSSRYSSIYGSSKAGHPRTACASTPLVGRRRCRWKDRSSYQHFILSRGVTPSPAELKKRIIRWQKEVGLSASRKLLEPMYSASPVQPEFHDGELVSPEESLLRAPARSMSEEETKEFLRELASADPPRTSVSVMREDDILELQRKARGSKLHARTYIPSEGRWGGVKQGLVVIDRDSDVANSRLWAFEAIIEEESFKKVTIWIRDPTMERSALRARLYHLESNARALSPDSHELSTIVVRSVNGSVQNTV
ncbi:hypothetical protein PHLCEN_2v10718 [Hermanssonia centrifuga]|uniref:Uncharacterized protein n=1 Tax=Hermanssonia centrifuga TaxID=98765 RepID=A0A2R6NMB5_9APHY|nr:hypothetical protein PHLCEN_2v10718 [Hermanssonia centrifuga]